MGLRLNTNIEAFSAHRQLSLISSRMARSMQRLSTGLRINSAADDAAGLGISERMRSQISGLAQAERNAQDGISLVQTADGALSEVHSILHHIRDLAVQYQNGSLDADARFAITTEVAALSAQIDQMATTTSYNGIPLISNAGGTVDLQVGANAGETMTINLSDVAVDIGSSIDDFVNGTPNLTDLDTSISAVSTQRGAFGAVENRLEYTISALGVAQENLIAAESRIRDADVAQEMMELTRLQVLQEASIAMLAQANQNQRSLLALLQR